MKILAALSLGAAAVLAASLATPLNAQNQTDKSKDETKVYAYQKRLPGSPPADPVVMQKRQTPTPSYMSDEVPYGGPGWWREHERISGGSGSE